MIIITNKLLSRFDEIFDDYTVIANAISVN